MTSYERGVEPSNVRQTWNAPLFSPSFCPPLAPKTLKELRLGYTSSTLLWAAFKSSRRAKGKKSFSFVTLECRSRLLERAELVAWHFRLQVENLKRYTQHWQKRFSPRLSSSIAAKLAQASKLALAWSFLQRFFFYFSFRRKLLNDLWIGKGRVHSSVVDRRVSSRRGRLWNSLYYSRHIKAFLVNFGLFPLLLRTLQIVKKIPIFGSRWHIPTKKAIIIFKPKY